MSEERDQRSNVPAPPSAQGIPMMSAVDRVKSDFGIDVPIETVPLPSGGKVYSTNSPLYMKETVDIKGMTTIEEDILTSPALLKKGTVVTELIRSCLIDKAIDPIDMLLGDRNALMVAIRITGYGHEYDVEVTCNECQYKAPASFNLAELPIRRLDISPTQEGTNLFEFVLPYCNKSVRFKFMTGRDEEEIISTANRQKKLGMMGDHNITMNLMHNIVSVDGISDRSKIGNFVRMMPARDSLALRNYIRDHEPGLVMRQEVTCQSCGHSEEVSMPMATSFLWPGARQ